MSARVPYSTEGKEYEAILVDAHSSKRSKATSWTVDSIRHGDRVDRRIARWEEDGVLACVRLFGLSRASLWPPAAPLAMGSHLFPLRTRQSHGRPAANGPSQMAAILRQPTR